MALNPVAYTENVVRSFLRYQLTAYPFSDPRLHAQMRALLSLDETRRSPLLKGPYVSLSRPFREGACLIRRLRASCNAEVGHTTCVATSATIVDREDPGAAREFASRFFGVEPVSVATVGEDYEAEVWTVAPRVVPPPPTEDPASILARCVEAVEDEDGSGERVRVAWRALSGEELEEGDWPESLHAALSRNELVFRLNEELRSPRALEDLPEVIESSAERPATPPCARSRGGGAWRRRRRGRSWRASSSGWSIRGCWFQCASRGRRVGRFRTWRASTR